MAAPLKAGMPPDLDIIGDYRVRLTAIDATTGAVVSGVVISGQAIQATDLAVTFDPITRGEWSMVPGPPDSGTLV